MNKKQFDIWVKDMVTSYNNRGNAFSNVRKLTLEESAITGKTIIMNIKTGKTSVAKCHKDDKFSPLIGLAVAWAKYLNKPIPIIADCVTYKDLKFLDKFYTSKVDNAPLYEFVGTRKTDTPSSQVTMVIFRNPKNGELFEETERCFTNHVTYNGMVWRTE
jgi:hypothetical protein